MEPMKMFEQSYTPEQLQQLAQRLELVGEERIRRVEGECQELCAKFRQAMEK